MGNINIGKKIIEYRRAKNITIREFSELTGLSSSMLSQLERNIGNPTIGALQSVAKEMGISLSELLVEEIANKELILRKEMRKKIYDPDETHVIYDMLTQSYLRSNVEVILMHLKIKCETYGGFSKHEGEEVAYILKGKLKIVFEYEEYDLYEGDTVHILPNRKHKFKNIGDIDAEVLFIKSKLSY